MLRRETLFQNSSKRIECYIMKHRRQLVMSLQEWDRLADGTESMGIFSSWGPNVAAVPCERATRTAVERFWQENIAHAKALTEARVLALENAA